MPDMQQIYEFLNSIEGAGYGGMAEFEIAREAARSLAAVPAQGGTTELKKLADGCRAKAELFAKNPNPEVAASFVYVADAIDYILRAPPAEGATSSLVERRPDLMDGDRYSNIDIAKRMWETFNSCGDRWFKYAAQRLERQSPAASASEPAEALQLIKNRLADLREANEIFRKDPRDMSRDIHRNDREIRYLADLNTLLRSPSRSQPETDAEVFMVSNAALTSEVLQLRAQVERAREALQFVIDGYPRLDVNHQDYRVKVYAVALDAMSAFSSTESNRG
jgi:hypothetical protein